MSVARSVIISRNDVAAIKVESRSLFTVASSNQLFRGHFSSRFTGLDTYHTRLITFLIYALEDKINRRRSYRVLNSLLLSADSPGSLGKYRWEALVV